ncbi:YwqJ-related putative deaminase [Photobacterium sp. CCB-ST2H9]|uniref:YwqJ-related putative deaminase n=1 Tax=Photobacterium sp. CCB-ST2H9 TaxID=2912855 RepID=UPI002002CA55|nr:YwqJ-related putative deaminase [Photobacterium sp. CCB-ST2H9]UTM59451.1 YwqJ-related putative deaminase [Photobacterium sp. CCB-ST2H9]
MSRAGVDESGIVSKNYTFPGVRRLDDQVFGIDDHAAYIKQVEKLDLDSGNTLNSVTRARILEHVGDGTRQYPTQAGIPGLQAEVQSVNSVINQVPVDFDLSKINVSTIKLAPGPGQGLPFPACSNCGGILSNSVNILTGVK